MTTPTRTFPLQQWYVAAVTSEVSRTPLARPICREPLVLYRRQDGTVATLDDRCPHRSYPLSSGELVDDDIECGGFAGDRYRFHLAPSIIVRTVSDGET